MIEKVTVATSRLEGGAPVRMYDYAGNEKLTLGQLMNAICCRAGMALEDQSVTKSNLLLANTDRLTALSEIVSGVSGTATYETVIESVGGFAGRTYREFLTQELGLEIDDVQLPKDLDGYERRARFYDGVKTKIQEMTNQNQEDLIDLQVCLSRRDVVFSIARNSVRTLGGILQETATNFA